MIIIFCVLMLIAPDTGKCNTDIQADENFRFASSFQQNMVLQMKPHSALLWGYGTVGAIVNVSLVQDVYSTKVVPGPDGKGVWKVILKPQSAGGPHTFQAVQDNHGLLSWLLLKNVLFGDVWICGGQSNMQFTVSMGFNSSLELNQTANYSNIRVMTPAEVESDVPLYDFQKIEQSWSIPSSDSIGGPTWTYFSAVCWYYGKYLYDQLEIPIGLISPNWGGTPIECWSSPEALKDCGLETQNNVEIEESTKVNAFALPINNSVLWNAMIQPLLNMTIKGAIWYQGESNMYYHNTEYACSFPRMIQSWRDEWFKGTHGQTDPVFPFGFVQLSTYNSTEDASFAQIRWHQTADYGFVPNIKMPSTFMAVAIDLGDLSSPYGSIHPRDKQDVARRLVLGALNVAYHRTSVNFQGPVPTRATIENSTVVLTYKSMGKLKVSKKGNFEVCCSDSACNYEKPFNTSGWHITPILFHSGKTVTISSESCSAPESKPALVRYAWEFSPCNFMKCSIYGDDGLPAPPYVILATDEHL